MDIDVKAILSTIGKGIADLAQKSLANYLTQAKADGQKVLNAIEGNIQTWANQVASGAMTPADLKFLIAAQKELLVMQALTQAGIAQIELDKFKQGVIDLIVSTIEKAIKI